jgi:putative ABC transport system permease protein
MLADMRLALRRLLKHPAATFTSIVTLSFAIGAAGATWSILNAVLLRPLPVADPATLVMVGVTDQRADASPGPRTSFLYPVHAHIRERAAFEQTAAMWAPAVLLPVGSGSPAEMAPVSFVSGSFFDVAGVPVPIGRGFRVDDDRRGAAPVGILSHRYWRAAFNADPAVVGRSIQVRGQAVTIVGVADRRFRGLSLAEAPALYVPLELVATVAGGPTNYFADPSAKMSPTSGMKVIGRLRSAAGRQEAVDRLAALPPAPTVRPSDRWVLADINAEAVPVRARAGMAQFARILGWTVALLLVIGCITVGILLLVRTEARASELAVCRALGASRARLALGIVVEGALLAAAGALGGLPVAAWLFSLVGQFQLPGGISLALLELTLDGRAVAVCAGSAAVATTIVAVMTGAVGMRTDVAHALHARAGATPRVARRRMRAALAVAQVAIALVLVAVTGLFARSLAAAVRLNETVDGDRVLSGTLPLTRAAYTPVTGSTFFSDLSSRLANTPPVSSVATSASGGGMSAGGIVMIDGERRAFPSFTAFHWVDAGYLATVGLRVRQGRDFTTSDGAGAPQVGIVSESFARMIAPGADALGRRIKTALGGQLDIEIVGVVDDVVTSVAVNEPLALYLPLAQSPMPVVNRTLVVRTPDATAARLEIAAAIKAIDAGVTPPTMLTLNEQLLTQMAPQQFAALVLGTLGTVALLMTLLGTYVLTETMAVLRAREMGIRAALGATRRQLTGMVVREMIVLVGLGLVIGIGMTRLAATTIRSFLLRVEPMDPLTLGGAGILILLLGVAVSLKPALRAARVDLGMMLKAE